MTYVSIHKASVVIGAVDKGRELRHEISRQELFEHHIGLVGALNDMYTKCGDLCEAHIVLEASLRRCMLAIENKCNVRAFLQMK